MTDTCDRSLVVDGDVTARCHELATVRVWRYIPAGTSPLYSQPACWVDAGCYCAHCAEQFAEELQHRGFNILVGAIDEARPDLPPHHESREPSISGEFHE